MDVSTARGLVSRFGSPLFVIREGPPAAAYAALADVMADLFDGRGAVAYAVKANPAAPLCAALFGRGAWADTAWLREAALAMDLGVPPGRILLNGPYKPATVLDAAFAAGILVDLETPDQIQAAARAISSGSEGRVGFRLTPPETHGKSRFGLTPDEVMASVEFCRGKGLLVEGLHVHYYDESWPPPPEFWAGKAEALLRQAAALTAEHGELHYLNLGGGLPEPTNADPSGEDFAAQARRYLGPVACQFRRFVKRTGSAPLLLVEPGRFLAQHSTVLVATAIDVRRRDGRTLVTLDAGISTLASLSSWEGGVTVEAVAAGSSGIVEYVGPSCKEQDVLAAGEHIPVPRPGSLVVFDRVGAYHLPHGSRFAEEPAPVVWVSADGDVGGLGSDEDRKRASISPRIGRIERSGE